jgi:hypothetical protein
MVSKKLQAIINKIKEWGKKWRIEINQSKSAHATTTLLNQIYPRVQLDNVDLPQQNEVNYLGMHLNRRLTWAKKIKTKRKTLNLRAKSMHLLLGRSTLLIESKLPLYKAVLKPIWIYGIQLWGTASNSKIDTLPCFYPRLSDPL